MKHILYISILLFVSLKSIGQTKQGYIDLDSIRINLPENVIQKYTSYTEKKMELETIEMEFEDSLEVLQSNYLRLIESPVHVSTEVERTKLEKKYSTLEDHIQLYYKRAHLITEQHKEHLEKLLLNIILHELAVFSKKHNISRVEDKKSVLYCLQCEDYTEAFFDSLKPKN